jgi:hypothetical protein
MYAHVKPKTGLDGSSLFKSESLSIDSRILGIDSRLEGEGGRKPFYRL